MFEFTQHIVSNEQTLIQKLEELDVLVVPSHQDNAPNVIVEALAVSLPVIGTSVGGITEMIRKYGGTLFADNDHKQLAKILIEGCLKGFTRIKNDQILYDFSPKKFTHDYSELTKRYFNLV